MTRSFSIFCLLVIGGWSVASCTHPNDTHNPAPLPTTEQTLSLSSVNCASSPQMKPGDNTSPSTPQHPQISPKNAALRAAPNIALGALRAYTIQDCIMHPTDADVLYLMRAARYREAADFAARAPQTPALRFVRQKARILANLCTSNDPCTAALDALSPPQPYLNALYDYWKTYARIADHSFNDAIDAIVRYHQTYHRTDETRALTLSLIQTAHRKNELPCSDNQTTSLNLPKLSQCVTNALPGANAFEAASLTHAQMQIALCQNDTKTAENKKRQLILKYPATQMALWQELVPTPADLAPSYSPNERFARIQKLIRHFDYDNAIRELRALIDDPKTPNALHEKARWELARIALTNSDEPELSKKIYESIALSNGKYREDAVFGIARAFARQLQYKDAIRALENYDKQFPNGKYKKRSLYLRGWYEFDLRNNEKARPLLKAYAQQTNDTSVWGFYAQTFLRDHRWQDAIDAFEIIKRAGNPIVRGKALYWQAFAAHQLGKDNVAKNYFADLHQQYPLTWYDFLAYAREAEWFGTPLDDQYIRAFRQTSDPQPPRIFHPFGYAPPPPPLPHSPAIQRILTLTAHDDIANAREFYQSHESEILNKFSKQDRDHARLYFSHLVESYHKPWKDVAGSIRAFSSQTPERSNPRHHMAYPQPFAPLVESLSMKYDIPPYFIYGIMLQESRFRPYQISSADAIGALQMIPKTAKYIAKTLNLEYHPETFFDPKIGFEYSAYYMHTHRTRWGGNLTFTAGSYNGGPHRIGPWALRDKGKTIDIIVDEFSFDESRHYARKVAEHTLRFAYLYAPSQREWLDTVHALFPVVVPPIEPTNDWGM